MQPPPSYRSTVHMDVGTHGSSYSAELGPALPGYQSPYYSTLQAGAVPVTSYFNSYQGYGSYHGATLQPGLTNRPNYGYNPHIQTGMWNQPPHAHGLTTHTGLGTQSQVSSPQPTDATAALQNGAHDGSTLQQSLDRMTILGRPSAENSTLQQQDQPGSSIPHASNTRSARIKPALPLQHKIEPSCLLPRVDDLGPPPPRHRRQLPLHHEASASPSPPTGHVLPPNTRQPRQKPRAYDCRSTT